MPVQVKRKVRLTTTQSVLEGAKPVAEGFPMREWAIVIHLLDEKGNEVPANCFDKVTYKLHPTFQNPNRVIKRPPFKLSEQGWGEFDMEIVLHSADKGGDHTIKHDLHFQQPKYDITTTITFNNPKPGLLKLLQASGPVPGFDGLGEAEPPTRKSQKAAPEEKSSKKASRSMKNIDMEKLADGLPKLEEDDLLKVVQMVHEHKTPDTYIKNDVEQGEFHVDLYTLPDHLIKSLWQFMTSKIDV
ncbi:hypothetical protein TWF191_006198 [Orbilia oligospora]|uniref:YEATS domain-containing protein n=2 Tax=Orbilia oligospora TaxID=2813651 RepID=A0A7C8V3C0_ORBOL|nr:hypothetical protein TWF191_006198 [Orbilia oligospora]